MLPFPVRFVCTAVAGSLQQAGLTLLQSQQVCLSAVQKGTTRIVRYCMLKVEEVIYLMLDCIGIVKQLSHV